MDLIRIITAIFLFVMGCYFSFDLILNGFNWRILLVLIGCFVVAYWVWPKNNKLDNDIIDLIGNLVELPFRLLSWIFRGFVRVLRDGDGGIDL